MVNNKGQEVFTLEGTVLRKYPAENGVGAGGRKYIKNKFILNTAQGNDIYVTKFGTFSAELIGRDVRFEATKYNDTNYTVQGELAVLEENVIANSTTNDIPAVVEPVTKRRGRPSKTKVETATPSAIKEHPVEQGQLESQILHDLESVRQDAQRIIVQDHVFVSQLLGTKASPEAVATLIQALQAVRATLFIESNKRDRVADMKTTRRY